MWFRLASHLHLPLQEVMQRTTSGEYVEWCVYLERELNDFHRLDHYLAQLTYEVWRVRKFLGGAIGEARQPKDFVIKFKTGETEAPASRFRNKQEAAEAAMRAHARMFGIPLNKFGL